MIRIALLTVAALVALSACGGGGDEEEPGATTPAGDAPEATASPTDDGTLPEITSLCDLVTEEDVEAATGESASPAAEFKDVSCAYTVGDGSLNIERGAAEDFESGPARDGDLGEPVPDIGDQAAWSGFSDGGSDTLSVGKGDFYFQLRMNLADLDSAAQLEVAKDIAAKAVERLP